jgi:biopolymer transport protein ExbB
MIEFYDAVLIFLDKGGIVLYPLFFLTLLIWALLLDRYMFLYFYAKKIKTAFHKEYEEQKEGFGSYKIYIENSLRQKFEEKLFTNKKLIQVLYTLAPLIGLLGTVLGMIEIFDTIAVTGSSSAKSLSNGVALATIPTLCGMVIVVSSIFFIKKYEQKANYEIINLFGQKNETKN